MFHDSLEERVHDELLEMELFDLQKRIETVKQLVSENGAELSANYSDSKDLQNVYHTTLTKFHTLPVPTAPSADNIYFVFHGSNVQN